MRQKTRIGLAICHKVNYINTMRFGEHFLDELKARVRPSDVIGRYVKLKRQGREFAGLSPFSNEKTPSFFVNDEKGFYHCFSSGKHGDAISFLMEVEGLSFPEAVERLAGIAGMNLPKADPQAEQRAQRNKVAVNWMEAAATFFERALRRDVGARARDYLKRRGLDEAACQHFGIGYAPESFSALKDELVQQGASLDVLIEAGLLIKPDDYDRAPWDRFRNRIMFPIHDPRGRLVAFGGRALDPDAKAKYLNSPETPLFHKGNVLYHYPKARKAISAPGHHGRGLIVAEGYMDVIALARAGFDYAVAPLGTALSAEQLDLLWRAGPEPVLCFDGDKAGLRAAYRSVDTALPLLRPGQSLRFALLPDGQDPDDLITAKGAAAMQAVLDKALPLVDMVWQGALQAGPLETPEDRAGLKDRLFAATRAIEHEGVREQYKTALLGRFDQAYGRMSRYGRSGRPQGSGRYNARSNYLAPTQKQAMQPDAMQQQREKRIIGAIIEFPRLLESVDQLFFALPIRSAALAALQAALLSYWRHTNVV